jgi:hypothetical protein
MASIIPTDEEDATFIEYYFLKDEAKTRLDEISKKNNESTITQMSALIEEYNTTIQPLLQNPTPENKEQIEDFYERLNSIFNDIRIGDEDKQFIKDLKNGEFYEFKTEIPDVDIGNTVVTKRVRHNEPEKDECEPAKECTQSHPILDILLKYCQDTTKDINEENMKNLTNYLRFVRAIPSNKSDTAKLDPPFENVLPLLETLERVNNKVFQSLKTMVNNPEANSRRKPDLESGVDEKALWHSSLNVCTTSPPGVQCPHMPIAAAAAGGSKHKKKR